jgi:hypothetical protein
MRARVLETLHVGDGEVWDTYSDAGGGCVTRRGRDSALRLPVEKAECACRGLVVGSAGCSALQHVGTYDRKSQGFRENMHVLQE